MIITGTGRLGRDAELRTVGDKQVASFSVAFDVGYGQRKQTHWLDCSLWGARAEKLVGYLTKGTLVNIVGRPSIRTYESKGATKAALQCELLDVELHGGGKKDDPVADRGRATRGDDIEKDEMPF